MFKTRDKRKVVTSARSGQRASKTRMRKIRTTPILSGLRSWRPPVTRMMVVQRVGGGSGTFAIAADANLAIDNGEGDSRLFQ